MDKKIYLLFASFLLTVSLFSQHEKAITAAKQFLKKSQEKWHLTEADIADIAISSIHTSKHNGVTHIYFQQQYEGIKIYNALNTINVLPNGEVLHSSNRFLPQIATKVNATKTRINPETAIQKAALYLDIKEAINFSGKESQGRNSFVYKNTNISNSDIKVEPIYQLMDDGKLHLAWQLAIDMKEKADYWNIRIDALTGKILNKNNWTTHCSFGIHQHTSNCGFLERENNAFLPTPPATTTAKIDGSSYNVFAVPIESPNHGNRSIVNEPANPAASPFGWHDTNEQLGAEYTITRGNNAHAYADVDDDNSSIGNEPDGGSDLTFNFPLDETAEPETYRDAATSQLFYMTNMMHDISFAYGFTEAAGNFQQTNYDFIAGDDDYVIANAQDGYNLAPTDNEYVGNANFSTPSDGNNGRLQMYIWGRSGGRLLHINSPAEVVGSYQVGTATFGVQIDTLATPITGGVAIVNDGSFTNPTLGCNPVVNTEEVNGKITLIDRGSCDFSQKATYARDAGAIAVIICNHLESLVGMRAGDDFVPPLGIPIVSLKRSDCQLLKTLINEGLEITLKSPEQTGPDYLDGDFDNGIIAHEYTHGISTRLTGGRSNSSCLSNDEEMGEGWSDFFTLITSVKEGDTGKMKRGIGTYVLREETTGQGIRTFPFSTDMAISPYTHRNIIGGTSPHSVGQVWTAMLWDLYWAMSDEYGWEAGVFNGTGGNHQAIQLVMDGLKLQPCRPGFVDGRDAILAADQINNGGANECLIWEVFARRGLGYSAEQRDERDRNDAIEAFDVPPACTNQLALTKTSTERINAGGDIEYTITVGNYKAEKVTNLVLNDNLPEGLTYAQGSASMTVNAEGNNLRFDIAELASGEEMQITYRAKAVDNQLSIRQFYDDMENGGEFWLIIDEENTNLFGLQDVFVNSGENAWHVPNPEPTADKSEQLLQLDEEILITSNHPALRFFHQYSIDEGTAGGVVEISTDGGNIWSDLGPHFIRNGYTGPLTYFTFAIPNLEAFWGKSEKFVESYVDLSAFRGETVTIRFRFGSINYDNPLIPNKTYDGWFIDDVEFLDLFTYESEVCATTAEGDNLCAMVTNGGTVVDVNDGLFTDVGDLEALGLQFKVFPNPAGDYLNISLSNQDAKEGTVGLFNMNGQQLLHQNIRIDQHNQIIPFNVYDLPGGFYLVKVQTDEGIAVKKVILE